MLLPSSSPPATVKVAFALQLALVGTLFVWVAMTVAEVVHYDGVIDRAAGIVGADSADVAAEHTSNWVSALVGNVPAVLLAVWFGVTAIWLRRSNVARITTAAARQLSKSPLAARSPPAARPQCAG